MKTNIGLLSILASFIISFSLMGQSASYDKLIKINGDEEKVKVTGILGSEIKYAYPGETLEYTIPKNQVYKIDFASGRSQVITNPNEIFQNANTSNTNLGVISSANTGHQSHTGATNHVFPPMDVNMAAILPFTYYDEGRENKVLGERAQAFYYQSMQGHSTVKFQDPGITNSLMRKNGISRNNLDEYPMDELASTLGVGYLIIGGLTRDAVGATTVTSSTDRTRATIFGENNNKLKAKTNNFGIQNTSENYHTTFDVNIYRSEGTLMYNRSQTSVLPFMDAYKAAVKYVAKRTPFYAK